MKLITFARMGKVGFGVVKENGIIDLTGRIHNDVSSIKDLLKLDLIEKAEEFVAEKRPEISISEITHLPVIHDPEKIFCIGLNYQVPRGPKINFDYVYRDIGVFDNVPGYSLNIIF